MKLKLNISLFVLLTFTMSTVFAMTFTTTQAGANSSKDISVQVGKQYQLKFDLQHQTTSAVRIQILEGSNKIVDASNLADGSHVYSFTPTSNTVTLRFIREDNDNVSRDFEVNNLLYEEVLSTIQAESNHVIGRKEYELADHLGNVRAVISDKPKNGNAEVISATDYLPFGMTARSYNNGVNVRHGFNGKEKDEQLFQGGYDFGDRIYDGRLGRFLSVDRFHIKFPDQSKYSYASNMPMIAIDANGDSTYLVVYGAGYENYTLRGGEHDNGNNFKLDAEALKLKIESSPAFDPCRDAVVIVYAPNTERFVQATNTKYASGKIASLTVFSHGYAMSWTNGTNSGGVSLGGELPGEVRADNSIVTQNEAQDQKDDYDKREINVNTISQIDKGNFEGEGTITFYGCDIGGRAKDWTAADVKNMSFGQKAADYFGANIKVKAFTGSGLHKTNSNGDIIYDGSMIRFEDRLTQTVNLTIFQCGVDPVIPSTPALPK